ncbi:hypothetical protein J437_LFUL009219 [Ladona fulva]|uniref:Uncharacterized protein n=1 Tax=Ladona fulva TaxID=123851 RepID=A0A8K0K673_LADFU|nr:hypothetical protein J437_LFUL009219 [Ladona fulva]
MKIMKGILRLIFALMLIFSVAFSTSYGEVNCGPIVCPPFTSVAPYDHFENDCMFCTCLENEKVFVRVCPKDQEMFCEEADTCPRYMEEVD